LAPHFGHIPNAIGDSGYGICTAAAPDRRDGFNYTAASRRRRSTSCPRALRVPARRHAVFWHGDRISRIGSTSSAIFSEGLLRSSEI
jgi:predicted transcriptional regulator YdeE